MTQEDLTISTKLKPMIPGHVARYGEIYAAAFSGEPWKTPLVIKSYHDVFPDLHWRLQDIINSQIKAGLGIRELAELPARDASFWFTYAELRGKSPEELEGINDWEKNPMAALPAWAALISQRAG